jgi:hypothetical protein
MTSPAIIAIKRAVAAEFGVTVEMLDGQNRSRRVAQPRQVGMYLARHLTQQSSAVIGRAFGGRDPSTVLQAVSRIEDRISRGGDLAAVVYRMSERLRADGGPLAPRTDLEVEMLGRLEIAIAEAEELLDVVKRELRRGVQRLAGALQRERALINALRRGDA